MANGESAGWGDQAWLPETGGAAAPAHDSMTAEMTTRPVAAGAAADPGLRMSLEAVLLVADEPVPEQVLADVTGRPLAVVAAALPELAASYTAERRGFDLREVSGGWRLYTRDECAEVVERFVGEGQEIRLTQAALETLAVVAYRQPVSRGRVSAVRGVNCDGVMRTLVLRGLVEEAGADSETGATLFRTTGYFLERLGLARLSDLPELTQFLPDRLDEELDPGHGTER
jgi:segregation and condensation protein B